ncbi:MAG: hypothetical protein V4448_14415 [Pseudomonadota bacterium]
MKSNPTLANKRARTAIGIGLSLLIHALILLYALDRPTVRVAETGDSPTAPLTVSLIAQAPSSKPDASTAITQPSPQIKKSGQPNETKQAKSSPQKKSAPSKTNEVAKAKPPPIAPKSTSTAPLPPDMSDMIQAARERRRAAGIMEPDSSDRQPAQDDNAIARANIAEMMQRQSRGRNESGGVFQITFKGVRTAEFLFRGWDVRRRTTSRQLITVDAGPTLDIDTAIVRRMIELIRIYEKGDFSWNSPRLGRVVILSARVQDSTELEEFLKRDFFEVTR